MRDALVVGINNYDRANSLTSPAEDAEAIAQILESKGNFDKVTRLPQATNRRTDKRYVSKQGNVTYQELKKALVQLFKPEGGRSRQAPDTALFYFSGHGLKIDEGVAEGYLVTSDVDRKLGHYGLSLDWLKKLLQESPVRQQIIWLDCCHSGQILELNFDTNVDFNIYNPGDSGRVRDRCFIAASRSFELAYEGGIGRKYSVLTDVLLSALQPDNHPYEWITNYDVVSYLDRNLVNANQKLVFSNFGSPIRLISNISYESIKSLDKKDQDVLVKGEITEDTDKGEVEREFNKEHQLQLEIAEKNATIKAQEKHILDLKEIIKDYPKVNNIIQNNLGKGNNIGNDQNTNNNQ